MTEPSLPRVPVSETGQIVELRGGTRALIRPIEPEDRERLNEGFESASAESIFLRFLTPQPRLTGEQLDCGSGVIEVGSGADLWSPFVDLATGRQYKPIAWNVSGEGFAVVETRSEPKKDSVVCSYDDGVATGTVTVKKA